MTEHTIRCTCGIVTGTLSVAKPGAGCRVVCMCDDCQSYAHFLGRASDILDTNGGTDIYQTAPSAVKFVEGSSRVKAIRMHEKGLVRWYADCCKTPLGNGLAAPRVAFVGIPTIALRGPQEIVDLDKTLGQPVGYIQGRYGHGELPRGAKQRASFGILSRALGLVLKNTLSGKNRPSPYHDGENWLTTLEVLEPKLREEALTAAKSPPA